MDNVKPLPVIICPYVGLQPYTEVDRDYFFGRERDIRIITSNLYAAPLTVLYGASGVGKSSVLRAGVVPRLIASPRTAVVLFDRWSDKALLNTLKARCLDAIVATRGKDIEVDTSLPLDEFLFAATQAFGGTFIIILDQFEEYFLYHPETESGNTFDTEFAQAVNREEVDANFLISMREDALSNLDRFRARIPNMLGNALRLRHLDATSARDTIRKPLEVYSERHPNELRISVEDALVEELIHEIRAGKLLIGQGGRGMYETRDVELDSDIRIETPFLQLVLTRLWSKEMAQGSRVLQLGTLNALGGAGRIVRTHMDTAMNSLSMEEQEIAAGIFRYLVTPSGTKIAYTIEDLKYYSKPVQPLGPVLEKLAQGDVRILRPVASPGEPGILRYEIYHDVLAPAVLDWRARYENSKQLAYESIGLQKQVRSVFFWAFLGAVVDLFLSMFFLPLGAVLFIPGLRKVKPPLSWTQVLLIALAWIISHFIFPIIGVFIWVLLGLNLELLIYSPVAIAIGAIVLFLSGPIGGLLAYWQVSKARERQISVIETSVKPESLARKYIESIQKMRL